MTTPITADELQAFRQYLGKTPTGGDDQLLKDLLAGARAAIMAWLGRDLALADRDEWFDGRGKGRLVLPDCQVNSVASVTVNGQVIPQQTQWGAPGWRAENWLIVLTGYSFAHGTRNINVRYSAGFDPLPAEVVMATHILAAQRYRERDWTGYQSKTLAGETVAFNTYRPMPGESAANGGLPAAVIGMLTNYKRVIPV